MIDPFKPPSVEPIPPPQPRMMRVRLPLNSPRIVYVLLGLNILVFLVEVVLSEDTMLEYFGQINPAIAQGEWWRLLTAAFLHIGVLHLAFNMYALYAIGVDLERLYGSFRFLIIYLLAGLGAGVATYVFLADNTVSAGASGAVFGVLGGLAAFYARFRNRFGQAGRQQLTSLIAMAAINLVIGFSIPHINNFAHIGGMLTGFILGWALAPDWQTVAYDPEGTPILADRSSLAERLPLVLLIFVVMLALLVLATPHWLSL